LTIRPSTTYLAELVGRLGTAPLTYAEQGQTRCKNLPAGYHYQQATAIIGRGDDAWDRAKDGLLTWQCHRGVRLTPSAGQIDYAA
jgi:uncharacterized protein (UPF0548 family)